MEPRVFANFVKGDSEDHCVMVHKIFAKLKAHYETAVEIGRKPRKMTPAAETLEEYVNTFAA